MLLTKGIKDLFENDKYIVICDTNVYLNIYKYSPAFSDFSLRCMEAVINRIYLPATVKYEYLKHYRGTFAAMTKKVSIAGDETKKQIENAKRKTLNTCNTLMALHYPDISELQESLKIKFTELTSLLENFFEDRNILDFIANPWGETDFVYNLVQTIITLNHELSFVTQEDIYKICEEGEKRYNANPPIPPGYKDAKNKDGVRKYSDLILWKEVIRFSKEQQLNIILVTDDVKSDWWLDDGNSKTFQPGLIKEFRENTAQEIIPLISVDFFNAISEAYEICQSDAIEIALRITDADYFERVSNDVFTKISDELSFSGGKYLEPSVHIGSNGIDELEIVEYEFISAEQVDVTNEIIRYVFSYKITVEGTSFDYWGRDDDTHEILLAPTGSHTFDGTIYVEVVREADIYLDFEADNGFESANIIDGNLEEVTYFPVFDTEDELEDAYSTCPDCGKQINFDNDGGNGFCANCVPNH